MRDTLTSKKPARRRQRRQRRGAPPRIRKPRADRGSWIPTLALATIIAAGLTFFAALQQPSIDGSLSSLAGRASLDFLVRNATALPIVGLRYSCVLPEITTSPDVAPRERPAVRPADAPLLWPNQSTTAQCENVYRTRAPLFQAQYALTLSYYVFPVPYRWNVTRTLVALIEGGRVVRWIPR